MGCLVRLIVGIFLLALLINVGPALLQGLISGIAEGGKEAADQIGCGEGLGEAEGRGRTAGLGEGDEERRQQGPRGREEDREGERQESRVLPALRRQPCLAGKRRAHRHLDLPQRHRSQGTDGLLRERRAGGTDTALRPGPGGRRHPGGDHGLRAVHRHERGHRQGGRRPVGCSDRMDPLLRARVVHQPRAREPDLLQVPAGRGGGPADRCPQLRCLRELGQRLANVRRDRPRQAGGGRHGPARRPGVPGRPEPPGLPMPVPAEQCAIAGAFVTRCRGLREAGDRCQSRGDAVALFAVDHPSEDFRKRPFSAPETMYCQR